MDRSFRNDMFEKLPKSVQEHSILKSLKREYTLKEICIMTRSAPAKILGLKNKGSLGDNCDADITIYDQNKKDIEDFFANPSHVIKDGKIVVKNGKIINYIWGKTQTVKPEYDIGIEKILGKFFEKYHTMKLDNFKISDDEMTNVIGSKIKVNECIHKRKK